MIKGMLYRVSVSEGSEIEPGAIGTLTDDVVCKRKDWLSPCAGR